MIEIKKNKPTVVALLKENAFDGRDVDGIMFSRMMRERKQGDLLVPVLIVTDETMVLRIYDVVPSIHTCAGIRTPFDFFPSSGSESSSSSSFSSSSSEPIPPLPVE